MVFHIAQQRLKDLTQKDFAKSIFDEREIQPLLYPDRVIETTLKVKMDDGRVRYFQAYRSQHNNARWPYKGGIRFHPDVTKEEVMALSLWMSIKTAAVDLPLGWWKWWVIVDPKELSSTELERLSREYVRSLYKYLGPDMDVPAPDVNTNAQVMAWMMDEYNKLVGYYAPWAFTGKPVNLGGSKWRDIATALGGLYVLEEFLALRGDSIKGKTFVIQGAGNAGLNFAKLVVKSGGKVVAISDSSGAIYGINCMNVEEIEKLKASRGKLIEYPQCEKLTNQDILELEADVLVLAALENQITDKNADKVKAKIILELANWPVDIEGDKILESKGIVVLPDILANAGGVTVSYFEQVQNKINYYWEREEVFARLEKKMKRSTREIIEFAQQHSASLRDAAYVLAIKRIVDAMKLRGKFN